MSLTRLEIRKLTVHTYIENTTQSFASIAKKFEIGRKTVSTVKHRYSENLTVERTPGGGCSKGPANPAISAKVLRSIKNNFGLSDRDRAKKCETSRGNVRIISARDLKSFKAVKQPNRNDKQNLTVKPRSRKLYDKVLTEFRPIKRYWALVNNYLNKNGGASRNEEDMLTKSNYFAEKFPKVFLMGGINKRV